MSDRNEVVVIRSDEEMESVSAVETGRTAENESNEVVVIRSDEEMEALWGPEIIPQQ